LPSAQILPIHRLNETSEYVQKLSNVVSHHVSYTYSWFAHVNLDKTFSASLCHKTFDVRACTCKLRQGIFCLSLQSFCYA
jgi:hypothetical protein